MTNNRDFVFFTNFKTKNNRYLLFANYIADRFNIFEDGGLSDYSSFENNQQSNKILYGVNLETAQNIVMHKSMYVSQYFNCGENKYNNNNDTIKHFVPKQRFSHTIHYDRQSLIYKDIKPNPLFYGNIFKDTINSYDSIAVQKIENQFSFFNIQDNNTNLQYKFSGVHQYIHIYQNYINKIFNNFILQAELKNSNQKGIDYKYSGLYTLTGYNKDDMQLNADFAFYSDDTLSSGKNYFELNLSFDKTHPYYFENNFFSNFFRWNNNFKQIGQFSTGMNWYNKYFNLKLKYFSIKNYIYFDAIVNPYQTSNQQNIFYGILDKNFYFGKWSFNNSIVWQRTIGKTSVRLPELIYKSSIFYKNDIFKKKLHYSIGSDIYYFSKYNADAYMPAIANFYIQNTQEIGNYPFIDLFLNINIKRFIAFIKYEHLNSGWMGYHYYLMPNYPAPDRSLKFGIQWNFYD
jgi:hypothetical protein